MGFSRLKSVVVVPSHLMFTLHRHMHLIILGSKHQIRGGLRFHVAVGEEWGDPGARGSCSSVDLARTPQRPAGGLCPCPAALVPTSHDRREAAAVVTKKPLRAVTWRNRGTKPGSELLCLWILLLLPSLSVLCACLPSTDQLNIPRLSYKQACCRVSSQQWAGPGLAQHLKLPNCRN